MYPPKDAFGEPLHYPPLPSPPPIFEAASRCDAARVARLLRDDPKLATSRHPFRNDEPLHHAAASGCIKVIELLLVHGAEIDTRDDRQMTPLHHAAESGKARAATLLVQKGADPYAIDVFGFTPLVSAARRFDDIGYKLVKALMREGVKCDLHAAVCLGNVGRVESLLRESPDAVRAYVVPGDLLFDALLMLRSRVTDYDPSPDELDKSIRDFGPICKLLVSHGVSPNESSRWSGPPLHDNLDAESLARFLIELGADVDLLGPAGERPLQIAEREGRTKIAGFLRGHGAH